MIQGYSFCPKLYEFGIEESLKRMGYCKAVGPHNISFELAEEFFIFLEIVEKCLSCCIYLHTILDDNWSRLWIYLFCFI
jgi:hypothetical protein